MSVKDYLLPLCPPIPFLKYKNEILEGVELKLLERQLLFTFPSCRKTLFKLRKDPNDQFAYRKLQSYLDNVHTPLPWDVMCSIRLQVFRLAQQYGLSGNGTFQAIMAEFFSGPGWGCPSDANEEIRWTHLSSDQKNKFGICRLAILTEKNEEDDSKFLELYKQSMELGNTESMIYYATCIRDGTTNHPPDPATALPIFEKAVELGEYGALKYLGYIYGEGVGVPKDDIKSFQFYQQSAFNGDLDGVFNLASCYEDAVGVPFSVEKATYWYLRAAYVGDTPSADALEDLYNDGYIKEIETNSDKLKLEIAENEKNLNISIQQELIKDKVLSLMLLIRKYCDTPFSPDHLPLDLFKLIIAFFLE